MAPTVRTVIVKGVKFSFRVLEDVSNDLPPPASSIVNMVQRIIDVVEV